MAKKKKADKSAKPTKVQLDLQDPRRLFCDRGFILFSEEHFLMALQSGRVVTAEYVFTPKHMKRFLLRLQERIAAYEKEHGKIEASLSDIK